MYTNLSLNSVCQKSRMKICLIGGGKDASEKDYYAWMPTMVLSVYCLYTAYTKSHSANHQLQSSLNSQHPPQDQFLCR